MELHQIRKICTSKETVTRIKRQPTEWKKMFASYSTDKGLIFRICKELKKLNRKNNSINKWANELNRQFLEGKILVANKYMKQCSTSFAIREIQIKTTLKCHQSDWQSSRKQTTNAGEYIGKKEPSYTTSGNVN
jgi:hypothetical protein